MPLKPDLKRLSFHLKEIARERNFETSPQTLSEVQSYLRQEFSSYGLLVREEKFLFMGQSFSNWIACFGGETEKSRPRFILGAHFDSVSGSPGADDNASGVAALLEAARLYADFIKQNSSSLSPSRPLIEFAAFNLEEYGMVGSRAYAWKLKSEKIPVAGMISLEMIGYASPEKGSQKMPLFLKPFYPDVGNFIGLVANTSSKTLLGKVKKIFQSVEGLPVESLILPADGWVFPDARLSDHSPFWDEGFPALLVTDTSFFRNPYYHSERDRIETLDLDFLARVSEAVTTTVLKYS